jgi:hypothetical protein
MNNRDKREIKPEILELVLRKALGKPIRRADFQTRQLQGGTVGDVQLVTGVAEASDGERLPYQVV